MHINFIRVIHIKPYNGLRGANRYLVLLFGEVFYIIRYVKIGLMKKHHPYLL